MSGYFISVSKFGGRWPPMCAHENTSRSPSSSSIVSSSITSDKRLEDVANAH